MLNLAANCVKELAICEQDETLSKVSQIDKFSSIIPTDPKKDPIKLEVAKGLEDGEMWKTMSPLAFKANQLAIKAHQNKNERSASRQDYLNMPQIGSEI